MHRQKMDLKVRAITFYGTILIANLIILLSSSSRAAEHLSAYDRFRMLFGNASVLQPYDVDQITSQILTQANCTSNQGVDCYYVIIYY
jgi:hypothetical protein